MGRQRLFPDPVMKIEQFVTLGVLAVMCSPVQSQSQGGTLARPTPPPQASQLLQQSGVSALRLIPGGGPHFVYDSRCNVWREVTPRETVLWPSISESINVCAVTLIWQPILQTSCIKHTLTMQHEEIDSADTLTHVLLVQ